MDGEAGEEEQEAADGAGEEEQEASGEERDYQEGDGYYIVYVNVETGEIEDFEYNSALGGMG